MRSLLLAAVLVLVPGALIGCSNGGCAIDTDCPLGNRCGSDNACHPIGEGIDAGAADAPRGDGAVTDARRDAPPTTDAGSDAGPPACPGAEGSYSFDPFIIDAACGAIAESSILLIGDVTGACAYAVSLDLRDIGMVTQDTATPMALLGDLDVNGDGTSEPCAILFPMDGQVRLVCMTSGCMITAMMGP